MDDKVEINDIPVESKNQKNCNSGKVDSKYPTKVIRMIWQGKGK